MTRGWPGQVALALVLALVLGTLAAVAIRAGGVGGLTLADGRALRFTVMQASLSACLSCLLAIPLARALARRRFPGRDIMVMALGAPFILPVIVAVMGILAIFGRAGMINTLIGWFGLQQISPFGLQGILIAHLFLNLPLATRLVLNGWAAIPGERYRTAQALDFGPRAMFRFIEVPMLRTTLPGAYLAVFLVCLTSFTVVLVLGGGPRATTLELAIYQAFRLDFDLDRAASLACLQMVVSLAAALAGLCLTGPSAFGAGLGRTQPSLQPTGGGAAILDGMLIFLAAPFLGLPIAMVIMRGLPGLVDLPAGVWSAALRSVAVSVSATAMSIAAALAIGLLIVARPAGQARLIDAAAMLALTASPLVMGTGLFLILHRFVEPGSAALPVTALVNAVMTLPFCLRILMPDLAALAKDYGRLADSLSMHGIARLRLVILPRLRRPLAFAAGLAAALSMGDLGVVALFAEPARATLPMMIYGLMGAYRMDQAASAALVLIAISFGLFLLFDRMGRRDADT